MVFKCLQGNAESFQSIPGPLRWSVNADFFCTGVNKYDQRAYWRMHCVYLREQSDYVCRHFCLRTQKAAAKIYTCCSI